MPVRLNNIGDTPINNFSNASGGEGKSGTATHLSTNIAILIEGVAVGAVQKLSINESRTIKMVNEVGTDGSIDSAPTASTEISGDCSRIRFNRQRIAEAFLRGYVHVSAQRVPFDIVIMDNFQGSDDSNIVITTLRNVWIKSISYSYEAESFIISESMSFVCESIESYRGDGESSVVGNPNNRGIPIAVNPFEQQADRGTYRGALDAAGLINAFDGNTL